MSLPQICVDTVPGSPLAFPALRFQEATPGDQDVSLVNADGTPYVLDDTTDTVKLVVLESPSVRRLLFQCNGTIPDDAGGIINFSPGADVLTTASQSFGEIVVKRSGVVLKRFRCLVEVELALENYTDRTDAPLTVDETRNSIRDRTASDNPLLQNIEFTDSEVIWALIRTVERFNEYGDPSQSYTTARFPYRVLWLEGCTGELFRIAAYNLSRNRMPVNAGGITTDDSARADLYLKLSEEYLQRFQVQACGIKRSNSWRGFTGSVAIGSFG